MGLTGGLASNGQSGVALALHTNSQTAAAGVAAINGTQNTLTWTAPNDGKLHTVFAVSVLIVAVNETGGAWQLAWTLNGGAQTQVLHAAGKTTGTSTNVATVVCDPNTAVTIQQSSALTVGTATAFQSLLTDV